jgi:hypothetical protein
MILVTKMADMLYGLVYLNGCMFIYNSSTQMKLILQN